MWEICLEGHNVLNIAAHACLTIAWETLATFLFPFVFFRAFLSFECSSEKKQSANRETQREREREENDAGAMAGPPATHTQRSMPFYYKFISWPLELQSQQEGESCNRSSYSYSSSSSVQVNKIFFSYNEAQENKTKSLSLFLADLQQFFLPSLFAWRRHTIPNLCFFFCLSFSFFTSIYVCFVCVCVCVCFFLEKIWC